MSATGYTPIQLYYSATGAAVPLAANLVAGELAINTNDGKLYYKDSGGTVQLIASKATGSVPGSTTQVVYNNAGALAGSANMTFNGTTLTVAGLSGPLNGTVGATTPSTGAFTTLSASSTVSGSGFSTYLASPPAIGGTAAAAGSFTTLSASGALTYGGVTLTAAVTGTGKMVLDTSPTVNNPTVTNYVESVVAIGTVTSSNTLSLTNGTVQTATLTASTACTFTMPTATAGKSFVLLLKQAASTGNGSATFTGVKWGTSGAPTITATAGKMDILTFIADGTNWYGSIAQGYTP